MKLIIKSEYLKLYSDKALMSFLRMMGDITDQIEHERSRRRCIKAGLIKNENR